MQARERASRSESGASESAYRDILKHTGNSCSFELATGRERERREFYAAITTAIQLYAGFLVCTSGKHVSVCFLHNDHPF